MANLKTKKEVETVNYGIEELDIYENVEEILELNQVTEDNNITIPKIVKIKKEGPKTTASYKYTDENGKLLYEILRREGGREPFTLKSFDEEGNEIYKLPQNTPLVPYNYPNVLEAIKTDRIIWITEGESKADTLNSMGFVATTCAFSGEEKWSNNYSRKIKGAKKVITLIDNDLQSEKFANHTADSLIDCLKNVEIVPIRLREICSSLPIGGDIDDLVSKVGIDTVKVTLETIEANFDEEN